MITLSPNDEAAATALDIAGLQREIKRMAAATPQIILLRLKEEWGTSPDANLYKELEMEKKRWMLSALYNLDSRHGMQHEAVFSNPRVLAFFETQGKQYSYAVCLNGWHLPT